MKKMTRVALFFAIFSLSLQYVGCGGAEISSAKLYRGQRNYPRANELLLAALKSDPHSDEGWALYVQNLYDLKNYEKIAEVIDTARLYAIKNRGQVEDVRHNTWIQLYNGGVGAFNQNPESSEAQKAAINLLEYARRVAPDQPETYEFLGEVYFAASDTAKAMGAYEEALKQVRSSHDQGVSLGVTLRMSPDAVEKAIGGAPSSKQTLPLANGSDSILVYTYRSSDGFFYFTKADKAPRNWQLVGWRFTTSNEVGMQPMVISINTYLKLASYYYAQGNAVLATNKPKAEEYYNKVIPLLVAIQRLDPSDENAANIIPDIYSKLDAPDKAKSMYKRLLNEHPSIQLYAAYGAVLLKTQDYQGGIEAYEKALTINPAYENALYNLGVAYQNWAAETQKKDKKADVKPMLEKSVSYYERVRSVNPKDYASLSNLYQLYDILGKKDMKDKTLADLESFKNTDAANDKWYWDAMMKVYAANKNAKGAEEAMKMYDKLSK